MPTSWRLRLASTWRNGGSPPSNAYLGRVSKKLILEAVTEAVSPEAADNVSKLKKDEFVSTAGERLAGTGWLPAILRKPAGAQAIDALAAE